MFIFKFIIELLFVIVLFEIIIAVFFWKKETIRFFLLNFFVTLLILFPNIIIFKINGYSFLFNIIASVAVSIFPVSYSLLIRNFVEIKNKISFPVVSAISIFFLTASIILTGWRIQLLSAMLVLYSIYLSYLFFKGIFFSKKVYFVMQFGALVNLACCAVSFFSGKQIYYSLSAASLVCLSAVIFLLSYYSKSIWLAHQLQKSNELNAKLIHTISRLRQKSEQLKRVIQEKDIELLQMSKHASLAEVTTGIAHELTQPLAGIKGIAQNMIDDINYDEFEKLQAVSELIKICSLVDKSSSIIDHIRNFSKKNGINMQFVDINRIIMDAIDLINLQFKKADIDIVLVLNENIKKIYGDKISLEQLIINLLLNARDAINERKKIETEGFTGTIKIISDCAPGGVRLLIEDNGIGISQELIRKIWSPFFTTKRRGNSTGIGLSISNKILREHHAQVSVESLPRQGARFTIDFPVRSENQIGAVI